MAEADVRERIEISPEDLEEAREAAREFGVELEVEERVEEGIAPIVILAFIGAGAGVAGAIAYFQERRLGGQIIDLRPGEALTKRDKSVVYGLVVIIAADGKVTVEVKEPKTFFGQVVKDVLDAVQGIAEKTMDAAAAAAKAVTGDRANVTVEPAPVG